MSIQITFDLSDKDLDHFREIIGKTRDAASHLKPAQIIDATAGLLQKVEEAEAPEFILERLRVLECLKDMVTDAEWNLSDEEKHRVLNALMYFSEPDDIIPDHVPGLGFLDDAIMVELVARELEPEIEAYKEFCGFRSSEEARRQSRGDDAEVTREEWLKDKRAALHSRMRRRRAGSAGKGGWKIISLG